LLKAARGTLDSDTLRREGDRVMEELGTRLNTWRSKFEERVTGSLEHYFDPQQGTFMERVHRLAKDDGDLATVVRHQVQEAQSSLARVLEQFIGENSQLFRMLDPTGDNQLVMTLQRTLDGVVQAQNQAIAGQFSLDNKDGALVRFLGELTAKHGDLNQALSRDMQAIVAEFSLDKEDSALSRLVSRVETAQRSLIGPDDKFATGGMVELDTGNARYLIRFTQTLEQQAGWSWAMFNAVRRLSG